MRAATRARDRTRAGSRRTMTVHSAVSREFRTWWDDGASTMTSGAAERTMEMTARGARIRRRAASATGRRVRAGRFAAESLENRQTRGDARPRRHARAAARDRRDQRAAVHHRTRKVPRAGIRVPRRLREPNLPRRHRARALRHLHRRGRSRRAAPHPESGRSPEPEIILAVMGRAPGQMPPDYISRLHPATRISRRH